MRPPLPPTRLRFVAPRGSPGFADVLGLVAGLPLDTGLDLTFARGRRVDRVVPSSGPVTGGTIVTVVGDGFGADCVVAIGGRVAATRAIGSVALEAVTPPHAAGTAGVEVLRCGDRIQAPRGFVYVDPAALPGGVGGGGLDGELNVTVVETGTDARIPGVTVMVGVREDSPFVGLTDALGQITFRGDALRGPVTVTAFAEQKSAETYVDVDARDVTLVLAQIQRRPATRPTRLRPAAARADRHGHRLPDRPRQDRRPAARRRRRRTARDHTILARLSVDPDSGRTLRRRRLQITTRQRARSRRAVRLVPRRQDLRAAPHRRHARDLPSARATRRGGRPSTARSASTSASPSSSPARRI
ncbi:MAG: IPT/TIG domain-containing protein [Myxococcales bacterium]|nr:IPT/TIG domain-containing protein [Myxococcales bacterium]